MAKRRPEVPEVLPPEPLDLEGVYSAAELSPALESVYAELGIEGDAGQVNMYVSLMQPDGRDARIWQGPPADYDLWALAHKFGSGDYRVKVYVPLVTGKLVKRGQKDFPMLLEPGEDAAILARRAGTVPGAAVPSSETLARIVAEAVRAAMPAQPAPQVDVLGMMEKLAGVLKMVMPSAAPAAGLGVSDVLNLARSFMETSRSLAPDRDSLPRDEDGKVDAGGLALARGVDLFANMIEKAMGKTAAPAAPGAPPVALAPASPEVSANPEDSEMLQLWQLQIRQANRSAARGTDAADFADSVFSMVPEDVLFAMANNPQWFEELCAGVPECRQHQAWYYSVSRALLEIAKDEGLDLTPEPQAPIVAADAKPGTATSGADPAISRQPGSNTGGT